MIRVCAPGRVNLIGEHTDYNQGFVLPVAIDLNLQLTLTREDQLRVKVIAENFKQEASFGPEDLIPPRENPCWLDYIKAVYWVLKEDGYPFIGSTIHIKSDIPLGAGLSSSAALEVAMTLALSTAGRFNHSLKEIALISHRAENDFVGVKCGIMDQFAVALAESNHALFIDCRNLDYRHVSFNLGDYKLVIVDSRVKRSLVTSAYNKRREECETAVKRIGELLNLEAESLRDISISDLKNVQVQLPPHLYKRSRYVIEENARVIESVNSLHEGNLDDFGYFMKRSHAGLRDLYDVSSPELDFLVDQASAVEGVIGARMTGAGFGGSIIVLARQDIINKLKHTVSESYEREFGLMPVFYGTRAAEGAVVY